MREILTEDGGKCQGKKQDKGCFHAAEVAKGDRWRLSRDLLVSARPSRTLLYIVKSFCISCEIAVSRNRILGRGKKCLLRVEILLL